MDVEEILLGILDAPIDDEVDVDGVFVTGQHQALFLDVLHARAAEAALERCGAHTDFDDVLARHLGTENLFDGVGPAQMEARFGLADILAEAHDDTELVLVDAEEEGIPGDDEGRCNEAQEYERAGNAAAVHDLAHAILAALQHILEIRGLIAGTLAPRALVAWALSPGTSAAAASSASRATATTTLIAPGHKE